jgi:hypothetical protein
MKSPSAVFPMSISIRLSLLSIAAVLHIACACGSGNAASSSKALNVSVRPVRVTVSPGNTQQLTATVTNSANTAVTWSTTFGTISTTGLLSTPPATADMTFRVTATSKADRRKSAYSLITVTRAPLSLTVAPASVTASASQGLTSPTPISIQVTESGGGTFAFTARSDQSWLTVSPLSGAGPSALQVIPSIVGLTAGTYTGHVSVTVPDRSTPATTATVVLIVKPVRRPQADISWHASTGKDVVSYRIYRSAIRGGPYGMEASALTGLTYSDLTVQSGQTYYYVATAVDDSGNESSYSAELRVLMP